jgi:hypothetical protein
MSAGFIPSPVARRAIPRPAAAAIVLIFFVLLAGCVEDQYHCCAGLLIPRGLNFASASPTPIQPGIALKEGEAMLLGVDSRYRRNHTGLRITAGQTYRFLAPASQTWDDAWIVSSPRGYPPPGEFFSGYLSLFKSWKSLSNEKWFALCGEVATAKPAPFVIGEGKVWTADSSGELLLFANDARHFYWNNSGSIWLLVLRQQ